MRFPVTKKNTDTKPFAPLDRAVFLLLCFAGVVVAAVYFYAVFYFYQVYRETHTPEYLSGARHHRETQETHTYNLIRALYRRNMQNTSTNTNPTPRWIDLDEVTVFDAEPCFKYDRADWRPRKYEDFHGYCSGVVCWGTLRAAQNCGPLDNAGITHIVAASGQCSFKSETARDCRTVTLDNNFITTLRRTLVWREGERLDYCVVRNCSLARGVRVFVHSFQYASHGSALAIAFMMADDVTLTYDQALKRLRDASFLYVTPHSMFELGLRLYERLGVGSDDARCAFNSGLLKRPRRDYSLDDCECSEKACAALKAVAAQRPYLLPHLWYDAESLA